MKLLRTTVTGGAITTAERQVDEYLHADPVPLTSKEDIVAELSILASLSTPIDARTRDVSTRNVIQLREFYEEPHPTQPGNLLVYIVTELLAGGDLLQAVEERGSLSEEDARGVFKSLLRCLVDLKMRGVIHRDVKLENIALKTPHDFHNGVTLMDFGLATDTNLNGQPTACCGTPLNVAPEIIEAAIANYELDSADCSATWHRTKVCYGFECDVWSAGVALFAMLSGETAFRVGANGASDLYASITAGRYNFWDPAWQMVSDSAKDLVIRCLTVDPKKRITAQEALGHPWLQE